MRSLMWVALAVTIGSIALAPANAPAEEPLQQSGATPAKTRNDSAVAPALAFGIIEGIVTDSGLVPIEAAAIAILPTSIHVETGGSGRFRITHVPAGRHMLLVRRLGYEPVSGFVEVVENDTLRLAYTLERIALVLDTSIIKTQRQSSQRLAAFELRRRVGMGRFVTRAEIDAQNPTVTTELLGRVLGVAIADSAGIAVAVSTRGRKTSIVNGRVMPTQCVMPIAVDGFVKDTQFPINSIPPVDIHGIEIYVEESRIPLEFHGPRANMMCGLIAIWTRSGMRS